MFLREGLYILRRSVLWCIVKSKKVDYMFGSFRSNIFMDACNSLISISLHLVSLFICDMNVVGIFEVSCDLMFY
jgi:hypothetical protein